MRARRREPPCPLGTGGHRPRKPRGYNPDSTERGRVAGLLGRPSRAPPSHVVIGGPAVIDRAAVHSLRVYAWPLCPQPEAQPKQLPLAYIAVTFTSVPILQCAPLPLRPFPMSWSLLPVLSDSGNLADQVCPGLVQLHPPPPCFAPPMPTGQCSFFFALSMGAWGDTRGHMRGLESDGAGPGTA